MIFKKIDINKLYTEYSIEITSRNLAPDTMKQYQKAYELLRAFLLEKRIKNFAQFTKNNWNEFILYLDNGKRNEKSINFYLRGAKALLLFSRAEYGHPNFMPGLMHEEETFRAVYSEGELALLVAPPENGSFREIRGWAMSCLLIYCCPRVSTLANIKVEDLDFSARQIIFRKLKNKKIMAFPIVGEIETVLKTYLSVRKKYLRERGIKDNGYVFISERGEVPSRSGLYTSSCSYNKSREVERTGIHIFRNTFAMLYLKNGGDAFSLQKCLTHSNIQTTKRYVDIFGDELRGKMCQCNPLEGIIYAK